jgi:vacuolar-type H+-ATPase subunit E/Vma4
MSSQALIDKIIKTAENEAEQITDEILKRAGENEKLTLDKAAADVAAIKKRSDEKCAQIKRIAGLTSGLEARKARLHARREVIDSAFDKAYKKMTEQPDNERAAFLKRIIEKYAPAGCKSISVAEADLPLCKDLQKELPESLSGAAFEADGRISGGAYMKSDECDVDATLDAVFEELREKYEAEADKLLFG